MKGIRLPVVQVCTTPVFGMTAFCLPSAMQRLLFDHPCNNSWKTDAEDGNNHISKGTLAITHD